MTAIEKKVLIELVNECWETATAAQNDDVSVVAQFLKAHYYLMRFYNETENMKAGTNNED